MIADIKVCPRCAEDVKAAALVCKHCGHEFAQDAGRAGVPAPSTHPRTMTEGSVPASTDVRISRGLLYAIGAAVAVAIVAGLAWLLSPTVTQNGVASQYKIPATAQPTVPTPTPTTSYEVLAPGQQIDWEADKAAVEVVRQAGPYVVTISKKTDGDGVAPVVTVVRDTETVSMAGDSGSAGTVHHVALVDAGSGRAPMVMLQSFSGGAHCCNDVHLVADTGGMLRVVALGSFDGDAIAMPSGVSGDGVADFVLTDDAFLYAFAPYAMSSAPPKVLDVVDGRVIDVSAKPAFRRLFAANMQRSGETCRNGEDGVTRNGSCAAFVAAAARSGQLDAAWDIMLQHYAADVDWENPTGCRVAYTGQCPDEAKIVYKSYPEALLAFLRRQGYIRRGWSPPVTGIPENNAASPTGQ